MPEQTTDSSVGSPSALSKQAQDLEALAHGAKSGAEPIPLPPALNQDRQLIQDFLVEAREHLASIEACLLKIEQGAASAEVLHAAFRSFHTIKGLAGFLEFEAIQMVAHEVESLLDLARNGELALTPPRIDVILAAGDYIAKWLGFIEAPQSAPPADPGPLIERVNGAIRSSEPVAEQAPAKLEEAADRQSGGTSAARNNEPALVKVATDKLEYLVDMVGELVIAQSILRHNQDLASVKAPRLQRDIAQLSRVTAEVQKTAMALRMVPVRNMFRRMTRLVRDLAKRSGKKAELELIGEDTELDRTIVEELADPLVHMVRNSLDHGLEPPDERRAAGKPETGLLTLKAEHKSGYIVIELQDDGRGLNRERILARARDRGLVGNGEELTDSEICNLIFHPGFSTADRVTDVSGRGVGMDVVRKHVEKLRGRIEIASERGRGTTFELKLPLTLAIIDGLVVDTAGQRFIVPIFTVREMFKPQPGAVFTVEGRHEMVLVRERLLPVVRLARRLGLPKSGCDVDRGLMIVGECGGREFCLLVDALAGKQEVVIKSLGPAFEGVSGVAGGAILGDGRIGLILDMASLAASTRVGATCVR